MNPTIFEVCRANTGVTDLLGLSPTRFYPFGQAPQNTAMPYAVWQTVGGAPENYLGQVPDIDLYSLQVDVYALTSSAARDVAQAIRDAVEPVAHITSWRGESRDTETKAYRYSFDVDWMVSR